MPPDFIELCRQLEVLISRKDWGRITSVDIRRLTESYPAWQGVLSAKEDVFAHLLEEGRRVLAAAFPLDRAFTPVKDILFEGIILLFDTWEPCKGLLRSVSVSPLSSSFSLSLPRKLEDLMRSLLEIAGVETSTWRGHLRSKSFLFVFLIIYYEWLEDNTPGCERTLAILDTRLTQAQDIAGYLGI